MEVDPDATTRMRGELEIDATRYPRRAVRRTLSAPSRARRADRGGGAGGRDRRPPLRPFSRKRHRVTADRGLEKPDVVPVALTAEGMGEDVAARQVHDAHGPAAREQLPIGLEVELARI